MVNVGLDTGSRTPSARAAPRTNVVFPVPSSPETVTTSPARNRAASRAASASVSSGDPVTTSKGVTLDRVAASSISEEAELDRMLDGRFRHVERRGRRRGLDGPAEELRNAAEVLLQHLQHPRRVERGRRV